MDKTLVIVGAIFAAIAFISNTVWLQIVLGICAIILFAMAYRKKK